MKIGIPKEIHPGERRVAASPDSIERLRKLGYDVQVETGAGTEATFLDDAYREAGAEIVADAKTLWASSDLILKVRAPEAHTALGTHEVDMMRQGSHLMSFIWPGQNEDLMQRFQARKVTVHAMDAVPRISRAQKLDALSSMANIAGYRAVIEAANNFGRFFTGQITAAGKVPPAKVMVIGAGVAGLAAIGAAVSLGAIVRAFDTRPEVKDQVKSMGAEFLELDFEEDGTGEGGYAKVMSEEFIKAEMALFAQQAMEVDIIITTALIPGRPAPKLITEGMVESMREGSVIVDLAAETGGNCVLTVPHEKVVKHGVTIIGYADLPSRMSTQSSQLYATNLRHLITDMTPEKDGQLVVDMDDDVVRGCTIVKDGEITWPPPPPKVAAQAAPKQSKNVEPVVVDHAAVARARNRSRLTTFGVAALALIGVGYGAPADFLQHFIVFVLSCFVGYMVIWNVSPALHTPLMSVTNAISGIIVIGAVLQLSGSSLAVTLLSSIAVLIATINIAGGFLVTQRMLKMFQK
ncbi:NAD(P) transhydrogenase, alpha subunit [Magnetococcus marinus MC-1]|uniref:NAD(P) transhydrogenase subunit alpha n=1 Tax=Magnetococcus marinus (strain ATCC BAA-1437 / JCM 17883 / MC-1) TaxID=156889 RepID=A0L9H7_MAGMM|nr:Re/Si-specific NAD(P)(+) transhydrogenase subunit alpha [Magnetococcus marinus]ABK44620.1 NAD(P) transhydrogenase, alpha subunit [Magnetococcus marinus MC-1]